MIKIESLKHLKKLASNDEGDLIQFYIILKTGMRSGKFLSYYEDEDKFSILNEIDDSFQELTTSELVTNTMIVEAIEKGSFFMNI